MMPDARGVKAYLAGYKGSEAKNPFSYGPNISLAAWWDAGRSDSLAGKPCRFEKSNPAGLSGKARRG